MSIISNYLSNDKNVFIEVSYLATWVEICTYLLCTYVMLLYSEQENDQFQIVVLLKVTSLVELNQN